MSTSPPRSTGQRTGAGDNYRPVSTRRRILLLLLAVATALTVMFLLIERPGGVHPAPKPSSSPGLPECAPGQSAGCLGGLQPVTVLPAQGVSAPSGAAVPGR